MSFGLKVSFGRLCRLEKLREELDMPPLHELDADWLYQEYDDGISFILKAALPLLGIHD